MVKICPSCGTRAVDDQSLFCNKCGYPFPKDPPKNTGTVTRAGTRPLGPPVFPPSVERPPARASVRRPQQKKTGRGGRPPFRRFIARNIRLIYWLGAIGIVLVSLLGITAVFSTAGTEALNQSFTNTTALVQTPAVSPLFWIVFLIFGSLVWRIFCELVAAVFRIYDALSEGSESLENDALEDGKEWAEGMVECPRCGKVVPADQLRECEHCGVQGCSNCIRMMGLVRKTMTCKDCFENK
jgi:ribosomal protein L37E